MARVFPWARGCLRNLELNKEYYLEAAKGLLMLPFLPLSSYRFLLSSSATVPGHASPLALWKAHQATLKPSASQGPPPPPHSAAS